eukprot:730844-Prorocentrum_lima.AAC.1
MLFEHRGQSDTFHILLPNWCQAKEVLQKIAEALHLPHGSFLLSGFQIGYDIGQITWELTHPVDTRQLGPWLTVEFTGPKYPAPESSYRMDYRDARGSTGAA